MKIRSILQDYHEICERRYNGDYDAVCMILDLHTAIETANLTDRQRQILNLTYLDGQCFGDERGGQAELADYLGVSRQYISATLSRVRRKLQEPYGEEAEYDYY